MIKQILLSLIVLLFFTGLAFAQAPDAINYQAVARDGAGTLLANQSLTVRMGIYSGPSAATKEYEETHSVSTNQFGLFSLKIGTGTVVSGSFSAIGWESNVNSLKVEIDNGGGYVNLGTTQFVSVPYALHSKSADNAYWDKNGSNIYYNNGYVGIGTNAPAAGLHLKNSAGYGSGLSLDNTGGGLEWRLTSWTDGTFRIVKTTGLTFSPIVIEPVNGYIGIGTSTPDEPLSVHTSSGTSYIRVSDNTTGPTSGLRMGLNGAGNAYIINDESSKSLSLGTSGTTQVHINDIGHLGINTVIPSQMLHIKQDVANKGIRTEHQSTTDYWETGIGTTTKNYKFYYNNLARADIASADGSYIQSSDRRLKKDITYMGSILDKVKMLQPATYHYIDNPKEATLSTGFVAQEVEKLFPNLVREIDNGYKGVVYDGFAVISIKAIQEVNEKVEKMEKELEELRTLKQEVEELKQLIQQK